MRDYSQTCRKCQNWKPINKWTPYGKCGKFNFEEDLGTNGCACWIPASPAPTQEHQGDRRMSETENKTEVKPEECIAFVRVNSLMEAVMPIKQKLFELQIFDAQTLAILCGRYVDLIKASEGDQKAHYVQMLKEATQIFAGRAQQIEIPVDLGQWADHSSVQDSFGVAT